MRYISRLINTLTQPMPKYVRGDVVAFGEIENVEVINAWYDAGIGQYVYLLMLPEKNGGSLINSIEKFIRQ